MNMKSQKSLKACRHNIIMMLTKNLTHSPSQLSWSFYPIREHHYLEHTLLLARLRLQDFSQITRQWNDNLIIVLGWGILNEWNGDERRGMARYGQNNRFLNGMARNRKEWQWTQQFGGFVSIPSWLHWLPRFLLVEADTFSSEMPPTKMVKFMTYIFI